MIQRLRAIVRAIQIQSPTAYRFVDRPMMVASYPLVSHLTQQLYHYCYCYRFDGVLKDPVTPSVPDANAQAAFSARLAEGNAGQDRWEGGWRIASTLPGGQIMAQKGDSVRLLWGGEFVTIGGGGMPPAPGGEIQLYLPHESWTMQPGYYYALGQTATDVQDDRDLIRIYWNVGADDIASLLRLLTQTLNRFRVPFRFKCQTNPANYTRIDGTVLFVSRRYYHLVAELIAGEILPGIAARLDDDTPLFTKRLAPGLAVAEDPGGGESFGVHRCRLLAEGIWAAFEQGGNVHSDAERFALVASRFTRDGLDIAHPYLNAGSRDVYTLDAADLTPPRELPQALRQELHAA